MVNKMFDNGPRHMIDFTLHPQQVQPEHIVITSPYFRTEERRLQNGSCNHATTASQKARILEMRRNGLTYKAIGEAMGIHKHTAARICKAASV